MFKLKILRPDTPPRVSKFTRWIDWYFHSWRKEFWLANKLANLSLLHRKLFITVLDLKIHNQRKDYFTRENEKEIFDRPFWK